MLPGSLSSSSPNSRSPIFDIRFPMKIKLLKKLFLSEILCDIDTIYKLFLLFVV